MLHTVEEQTMSTSMQQPIYQLTKAERIASLKAELSSLKTVDISTVWTQAQKNREPTQEREATPPFTPGPKPATVILEINQPIVNQPVSPEHPF